MVDVRSAKTLFTAAQPSGCMFADQISASAIKMGSLERVQEEAGGGPPLSGYSLRIEFFFSICCKSRQALFQWDPHSFVSDTE